ncbi:MAG TPA: hypothetical protein VMU47_09950 [Caldimonas sp.]|nr:hypothetical protein [Caldimonas sp.]
MLNDDQLSQRVLEAKKHVEELEAAYKASIEDTLRGRTFDKGLLNRLTLAKAQLASLSLQWSRRNKRR